jgi:hypothetical protein
MGRIESGLKMKSTKNSMLTKAFKTKKTLALKRIIIHHLQTPIRGIKRRRIFIAGTSR